MQGLRLLVMPGGGTGIDASYLVTSAKWSGRNGSASRIMEATVIDDDGMGHDRLSLDVMRGDQCVLMHTADDGTQTEVHRGLIMSTSQGSDKTLSFKAYDTGVYLANNRDTFCYTDKTASQIFSDVCGRLGIPTGEVASTPYVISELAKPKATGWDVVGEALTQTYDAVGIRYFPRSIEGKMCLIERRKAIQQFLLDVGRNILSYSCGNSIEKIRTRIKAYDREDTVVGEAANTELESKIGIFQDIETADDEMSEADITQMVNTSLKEKSAPERKLTIKCLGHPDIVTGTGVFVRIPHLGIQAAYYVESDTHSFSKGRYELDLSLSLAEDTQASVPGEEAQAQSSGGEIQVGDTVNFAGGPNYISSVASSSAGTKKAASGLKVTHLAKGKAHPYHIEGSGICGWVDADLVSKG